MYLLAVLFTSLCKAGDIAGLSPFGVRLKKNKQFLRDFTVKKSAFIRKSNIASLHEFPPQSRPTACR